MAYINRMGGTKYQCNELTRQIWDWAIARNIWLSASYVPGVHNAEADGQSRMSHENTEWKLNPSIFHQLCDLWGIPDIDMFASRLNHQLPTYVSWKPDPGAAFVDAFSVPWDYKGHIYLFPPFCLVSRVLSKLHNEQCEGFLIAPLWPTQPWFPHLLHLLIDCPFLLPRTTSVLTHPSRQAAELPQMSLIACRLSGKAFLAAAYRARLQQSLCHHGDYPRSANTAALSPAGTHFAVDDTPIHFHHLCSKC